MTKKGGLKRGVAGGPGVNTTPMDAKYRQFCRYPDWSWENLTLIHKSVSCQSDPRDKMGRPTADLAHCCPPYLVRAATSSTQVHRQTRFVPRFKYIPGRIPPSAAVLRVGPFRGSIVLVVVCLGPFSGTRILVQKRVCRYLFGFLKPRLITAL